MFEYQITKLSDWMQLEQMMKSINYISDLSIDEISANKYKFSFMCNISTAGLPMKPSVSRLDPPL